VRYRSVRAGAPARTSAGEGRSRLRWRDRRRLGWRGGGGAGLPHRATDRSGAWRVRGCEIENDQSCPLFASPIIASSVRGGREWRGSDARRVGGEVVDSSIHERPCLRLDVTLKDSQAHEYTYGLFARKLHRRGSHADSLHTEKLSPELRRPLSCQRCRSPRVRPSHTLTASMCTNMSSRPFRTVSATRQVQLAVKVLF
jgi:hypothetical protein